MNYGNHLWKYKMMGEVFKYMLISVSPGSKIVALIIWLLHKKI